MSSAMYRKCRSVIGASKLYRRRRNVMNQKSPQRRQSLYCSQLPAVAIAMSTDYSMLFKF